MENLRYVGCPVEKYAGGVRTKDKLCEGRVWEINITYVLRGQQKKKGLGEIFPSAPSGSQMK